MKQLTIDWHALEMAFDDHPDEFGMDRADYFDVESGDVVFVDEEVSSAVDRVIDELEELTEEGADWTDEAIREKREIVLKRIRTHLKARKTRPSLRHRS